MKTASLSGSCLRPRARQRSASILSSDSLRLRSSALRPSRSVSFIAAVVIAVCGLLIGGAVMDREQQIQVMEGIQ